MSDKIKIGRPTVASEAATVKVIHVGLDEETLEALEKLEAAVGVGSVGRGRTSIAVRRALQKAAAQLDEKGAR